MNTEPAATARLRKSPRSLREVLEPAAGGERIERIDVLRGFMLLCLVGANLIAASRFIVSPEPVVSLGMAALDPIADILIFFFFHHKAYHLFAFLFGLGFALQLSRARERGSAHAVVFLRRMTWLFVFGAVHCVLLWWGDFLHIYALAGLGLLALRRAPDRTLVVLGLILTFGYRPFLWAYYSLFPGQAGAGPSPGEAVDRVTLLREGGYGEVLMENLREVAITHEPVGFTAIVAASLGLFLLGFWVGRRRWLEAEKLDRGRFRKVLAVGLLAGIPLNVCVVGFKAFHWLGPMAPWNVALQTFAPATLAAAYLAAVVLLFDRPAWRRHMIWLAPAGRMALTHYLMHSVFYFFILFGVGPGLGLAGRVGPALALVLAVAIFAFQVLASRWWLSRHRFGPAEWLWRALAYGTPPAWRLETRTPAWDEAPGLKEVRT